MSATRQVTTSRARRRDRHPWNRTRGRAPSAHLRLPVELLDARAIAADVNRSSARCRAAAPSRRRRSESIASCSIAHRSSATSSGGTTIPVDSSTASRTLPTSVAITGRPASIASMIESGKPSFRDGSTKMSSSASSARASSVQGTKRTRSSRPSSPASASSSAAAGPSPTSTRSTAARAGCPQQT